MLPLVLFSFSRSLRHRRSPAYGFIINRLRDYPLGLLTFRAPEQKPQNRPKQSTFTYHDGHEPNHAPLGVMAQNRDECQQVDNQ
jgi:hypothetical protein